MCLKPIISPSRVSHERNLKCVGILHFLKHNLFNLLFLLRQNREVEFVVHLQNHLRLDALATETLVSSIHSNLDDIGCRALYRSVYGIALGKVAHGSIVRSNVGQIASTMEEGFGIAVFTCQLLGLLHIVVHLRECLEIAIDELFSLVAAYLQTFGMTKDSNAVDYTEIGTFGLGALVECNIIYI